MSEEELIETLKEFEKNRVEKLKEPSKNLFYAIMKIADERDKYKEVIDKIKEYLNKVELGELENGKPYTFKDFLKEEKEAEDEEAKWLLELLEEIE